MAKAKSKTSNIVVWTVLGLLILALAGFGVDSFGGSVRSIGKVGDREISAQEYFAALQNEIRATSEQLGTPLSFQQAQAFGLDRAVLSQLVTRAALENETVTRGISIGDDAVRQELLAIPSFRGLDGAFDREAYRFVLQQQGLTEAEFEERLRFDVARSILQAAVAAGAPAPATLVDTVFGHARERRSFSAIRLDRSALDTPLPEATDADLQAQYEATPEAYTLPEARAITYVWLVPSMLIDTVEVDETALREAYDARATEFIRPERRLVERLIFPDDAAARAALARIESGEADFDTIAAERGFSLDDIDMGDVTEADLGGAAGAGVFALEGPGVAGPFTTPFGPALFRMNAILAAQITTFEEAEPMLRDELAQDRARRVIADQIDLFEDLLAGGAELEELAAQTDMELGRIDYRPGTRDGIAAYEGFRAAAAAAREGAFPEIEVLDDGGLFALRLDSIVPPQLQPLDDVIVEVIEDWADAETLRRLTAQAEALRETIATGAPLDGLGLSVDTVEGIQREGFVQGLPRSLIAAAFDMDPGETAIHPASDPDTGAPVVFVVTLDAVSAAETDTDEARQILEGYSESVRQAIASDLFAYFARQLESSVPVEINEAAVQAVHTSFR
jgi:peptidyl-prolyl cis-trans isomerase D